MAPFGKVLILSGLQVYPVESGGQLRTGSLADHLAAAGFSVSLFSLVGRKSDYLAGLPSATTVVHSGVIEHVHRGRVSAFIQLVFYRLRLPPVWIYFALAFWRPRILGELLKESDHVIADFPYLASAARRGPAPFYLSTHNVEARLWPDRWVRHLVNWVERRAAKAAQGVICCSAADQDYFASLVGKDQTLVVANGIRDDRFHGTSGHRVSMRQELGYAESDRVLLFTASAFGPNVEALRDFVVPFAAKHQDLLARLHCHILVVGSVSKTRRQEPRLTITGPVAQVEPYFAAADVAFNAVLRGSGTNIKMAEAMAAGLPILTSAAGLRGYDLVAGEDCLVFTEETLPDVLAKAPFWDDPAPGKAMARRAYEKNRAVISMSAAITPLVEALCRG